MFLAAFLLQANPTAPPLDTMMVNAMPKPETANTCGQCEYFDHGLADKATGRSDCLNRN
jgi:hypothetical protein